MDIGKEFEALIENLDSTMNCIGTGSKPRQLLAKPKKELVGNAKVKVDWMKDVKKSQSDLDRDHRTFFLAVEDQGQWHDQGEDDGCQQGDRASLQASRG